MQVSASTVYPSEQEARRTRGPLQNNHREYRIGKSHVTDAIEVTDARGTLISPCVGRLESLSPRYASLTLQ